jgi:hypothetical protein
MHEHTTKVLRFVTDLRVPPTNNSGKRAIRSYLDTKHKQGHHRFEVLRPTFIECPPSPASV